MNLNKGPGLQRYVQKIREQGYRMTPQRQSMMDEGRVVADGETAVLLQDTPFLEAHGLEMPVIGNR